jgi:hypothetical protein
VRSTGNVKSITATGFEPVALSTALLSVEAQSGWIGDSHTMFAPWFPDPLSHPDQTGTGAADVDTT